MKEKYAPEIIHNLADSINVGFVCYLNPDSLEIIEIPQALTDMMEFDDDSLIQADLDRIENEWEKCITIEPPESFESFGYMQRFAESEDLPDPLRNALLNALSNRKPFRNFKNITESSDFRQQWFDFHQKCLEEYVTSILEFDPNS